MMASLIKNRVNIANTTAWMKPTKTSKAIRGTGSRYARKNAATTIITSPAKMLPKRRKEKEMIRPRFDTISMRPTAKPTGDLKLTYLQPYFKKPSIAMLVISIVKKEIKARARVKFKSAAGARRSGIRP